MRFDYCTYFPASFDILNDWKGEWWVSKTTRAKSWAGAPKALAYRKSSLEDTQVGHKWRQCKFMTQHITLASLFIQIYYHADQSKLDWKGQDEELLWKELILKGTTCSVTLQLVIAHYVHLEKSACQRWLIYTKIRLTINYPSTTNQKPVLPII